jgi:GTP cyclohydrolase IA
MKFESVLPLVRAMLGQLGYDPDSEELRDTPARVARAWEELLSGKDQRAEEVLGTVFDEAFDEIVVSRRIPFFSMCEHHLLPFHGTTDIGYVPNGNVVGLSKLARLVDMHARRLQIQERMTRDIAQDIERVLGPVGVGVVVRAKHLCQCSRGVKKEGEMVTSFTTGIFRDPQKYAARTELFSLFNAP